jgi:hypothetical protein
MVKRVASFISVMMMLACADPVINEDERQFLHKTLDIKTGTTVDELLKSLGQPTRIVRDSPFCRNPAGGFGEWWWYDEIPTSDGRGRIVLGLAFSACVDPQAKIVISTAMAQVN